MVEKTHLIAARVSQELYDEIKNAAAENCRTMSGEILWRAKLWQKLMDERKRIDERKRNGASL
jgi:hypothetical protein